MPQHASGTFAARYEQGIRLRRKKPRETHADLSAAKRDPVAILAAGDRTRVPELIPERYRASDVIKKRLGRHYSDYVRP